MCDGFEIGLLASDFHGSCHLDHACAEQNPAGLDGRVLQSINLSVFLQLDEHVALDRRGERVHPKLSLGVDPSAVDKATLFIF